MSGKRKLALLLASLAAFGCACERPEETRADAALAPQSDAPTKPSELLAALGYVATEPPHRQQGVTLHGPDASHDGLNLYVSQHAREARLIDMDGDTLHVWRRPRPTPVSGPTPAGRAPGMWWRTVDVLPGGELLVQDDFGPLLRLDADSKVIWRYAGRTHHDFDVRWDGHIFALVSQNGRHPDLRGRVVEDFVVELDPEGRELRRLSLLDALARSPRADLLSEIRAFRREAEGLAKLDPMHTNAVEVLDRSPDSGPPAFRRGRILLSVPTIDRLVLLDWERGRIVWSLGGSFRYQHAPTVLANGNVLLFDNRGLGDRSRILEIDPATGGEVWSYAPRGEEAYYSECCGRVDRLPNGNTLVVSSQEGRAFSVTPEGEVAWEFRSPHSIGENVAILNDLVRIPGAEGAELLAALAGE